jgi:hypothetical protein
MAPAVRIWRAARVPSIPAILGSTVISVVPAV